MGVHWDDRLCIALVLSLPMISIKDFGAFIFLEPQSTYLIYR